MGALVVGNGLKHVPVSGIHVIINSHSDRGPCLAAKLQNWSDLVSVVRFCRMDETLGLQGLAHSATVRRWVMSGQTMQCTHDMAQHFHSSIVAKNVLLMPS